MKKLVIAALLLAPVVLAPLTAQAGDAAVGKTKSAVCAACHGVNGVSIAGMFPNLAGQKEAYLVSAIKAYRDGNRTGPMAAQMTPMVAALTDDDIANLAAYFSSL